MTATLLIPPKARFFNASGQPLVGGLVYTYAAGTLTPKDTYTTYVGNVANTNPVELDAAGEADIWLDGNYKISLHDANDVEIWTVDGVSSFSSGSITEYAVTTGTANNYILTPSPALTGYIAGQAFNIMINADNTGPSTINVSALGAKNLVVAPNYPLQGGELLAGNIYRIVYDGTNWQVLNPTPPIEITMGITVTAPWGKLPMNGTVTVARTSGATYNGDIYSRVYAYLWNNYSDSVAPVSTGRGATAAADFAANKNITIPDHADYIMLGVSGAGSITAAGVAVGATTVTATGTVGTSGSTTISTLTTPAHTHDFQFTQMGVDGTLGNNIDQASTSSTSSVVFTTAATGGGNSHSHIGGTLTMNASSVVQKSRGIYFYISY